MKYCILLLLLNAAASLLISQTTVEMYPTADCVVGFHDGENSANENAGNASHFSSFWQPAWTGIGENGGYSLMQFDLSSIPSGTLINSAMLSLTAFGDGFTPYLPDGHAGANACWLQRITEEWDEYEATWNTKPAMTATGQIEVSASIDPYENYTIDITTFIQEMVDDPASNFGFALKLQNESPTRGLMFHSSDAAVETNWPKLTVDHGPTPVVELQNNIFDVAIFPSPADNTIHVDLWNSEASEHLIRVINVQGAEICSVRTYDKLTQLNIESLPAGIYTSIVTDMTNMGYAIKQFIKL